jgi:sugar/nucleoside kinase (ribokinase family)
LVDVVCLGHILDEKIIFPDKVIYPVLGSPVAYSSVCMAYLGVDVGIVTKIGNDFPKELLEVFNVTGVDCSGLKKGDTSTKNELIYDKNGNKTLRFITKADSITAEDIPEEYKESKIFCMCPMDYEISLEGVKEISNFGKKIVADLGGYGGGTSALHPKDKDGHEIKKIAPYLDVAKASIEDLLYIFGENMEESEMSHRIIEWGAGSVAITLGEEGSYIRDEKKEEYIPPYPVKKFVDQTGAGDCFFAGFLFNYLKNSDPFEAAFYGNASSSYIVERSGGVVVDRMPDKQELKKRIEVIKKRHR